MTRMDLPSRSPPPKKAMLSACVRSRVCTLRKAPSRKYSCGTKAFQYAFPCPAFCSYIAKDAALPHNVGPTQSSPRSCTSKSTHTAQVHCILQSTPQVFILRIGEGGSSQSWQMLRSLGRLQSIQEPRTAYAYKIAMCRVR